jgi:Flp pilus assembly pilin Flp
MALLVSLWKDERGQDVIEYALLTAFVALSAAGVFFGVGGSFSGIWSQATGNLSSANTAAS